MSTEVDIEQVVGLLDDDTRETASAIIRGWLARGDGVAVYQNANFDSSWRGHLQFVSFGGPRAQLETSEPPERLPDIGPWVNHAYVLLHTCRPGALL